MSNITNRLERKERRCESCGADMGKMTTAAFVAVGGRCESCDNGNEGDEE